MQLQVRVFGGLAEIVGGSRLVIEVADGADVAALRRALHTTYPTLAPHLPRTAVAVDLEVAGDDTPLRHDAEVALLPPVAGGSQDPRIVTGLAHPPFDVDAVTARIDDPSAGATVMFLGTVRDHAPDLDDPVVGLQYTAYEEMARRVLEQIAARIVAEHPAVTGVALLHAVGDLAVGDDTILVVAAAPHRAEAFDACRQALEEVKERVPVFKRERTARGEHRWVGLGPPQAVDAADR